MSNGVCKNINVLSDDEDEEGAGICEVSPLLKKHKSVIDSVLIIDDESTPAKPFNRSTSSPILIIETPTSEASRYDFSISNRGEPSEIFSKHDQEHNSNGSRFGKSRSYSEQSPIFVPETPISERPKCSISMSNVFHSHDGYFLREQLISDVSGFDKPCGDLTQSPIFIQETPTSEPPRSDASFVNCSMTADISYSQNASSSRERFLSRITRMSCLDSINENERCTVSAADNTHTRSSYSGNFQPDITEVKNGRSKKNKKKKEDVADKVKCMKRMSEGEKIHTMIDKRQKKEKDRMQKVALKAEAKAMKKIEKEKKKWENGKFALKSILAEIDYNVVESGSVGGHLLTSFSEKGIKYRVTSNPIQQTVVWTMTVPKEISQISSEKIEIPYVVLVYMAEEFCNSVKNESFMYHVSYVQSCYPCYTICILTSNLTAYINKREQANYKNPGTFHGWTRPSVEEIFAKLTTDFSKVHSRQCMDEAEIAEHVVGLTCSLASCQFRKKPTRLSINANGMVISKDSVDKNLIKKNLWLKALVAIPKVQPRFAVAIWKKYPTMKSLLLAYMDSTKSVHEKEFMLKDLMTEGLTGDDRRVGEICSKRVYRILMAKNGNILTDDVEDGADLFSHGRN